MFNLLKSTNIYQTFAPFYWMLKIFGFACYGLNLKENKITNLTINKLRMLLYSFMYILTLIFMIKCGELESETEESLLVSNGWYLLYILQLMFCIIIVWYNFYYVDITKSILNALDDFDILTSYQSDWIFTLNHSKHRSCVVYLTIIIISLSVLKLILCYFIYNGLSFVQFIYTFCALLGVELTALVSFQFTFFSYCTKCRQDVLLKNFSINFEDTMMDQRFFIQIDKFSYCFNMLSNVIEKINSSYAIQVEFFTNCLLILMMIFSRQMQLFFLH